MPPSLPLPRSHLSLPLSSGPFLIRRFPRELAAISEAGVWAWVIGSEAPRQILMCTGPLYWSVYCTAPRGAQTDSGQTSNSPWEGIKENEKKKTQKNLLSRKSSNACHIFRMTKIISLSTHFITSWNNLAKNVFWEMVAGSQHIIDALRLVTNLLITSNHVPIHTYQLSSMVKQPQNPLNSKLLWSPFPWLPSNELFPLTCNRVSTGSSGAACTSTPVIQTVTSWHPCNHLPPTFTLHPLSHPKFASSESVLLWNLYL